MEIESDIFIKKEEDNVVHIKREDDDYDAGEYDDEEETLPRQKRKRTQIKSEESIDMLVDSISRMDNGLASLVGQYTQMSGFDEQNQTNTATVDQTIQDMKNYVYRLHKEGEVTTTLFTYCNNVNEATQRWNEMIVQQQAHMRDYVLNCILYNREHHALYTEMLKRMKQRRDPASPFNTIQTDIESITLGNENDAITSIF